MLWNEVKLAIGRIGIGEEALHIYAGVIIFALTLKLTGRPLGSILPLLVVFVAAILNEAIDIREAPLINVPYDWIEGVGDILNTILLSTIATFWARQRRSNIEEGVDRTGEI